MPDKPYDPAQQLGERDEPRSFEELEEPAGTGPSTMDRHGSELARDAAAIDRVARLVNGVRAGLQINVTLEDAAAIERLVDYHRVLLPNPPNHRS